MDGDRVAMGIEALRDPACYPHPVGTVELLQTHISYVLLAGEFAYKVKKPVCLPFLDFSTLAARRHFCEEELRLNRRTAPGLYLEVVPIGGTPSAPRVGQAEPLLDYAVKMRRFAQEALYSARARRGSLEAADVDALADAVAAFHATAATGGAGQAMPLGALDNFSQIAALAAPPAARTLLEALERWTRLEAQALGGRFAERAARGFVRECHGDLHLANVALIDARPVLFDCIEFSEPMRHIDVMSDVAFAAMDLERHGLPRLAARFVNRYLESTGDYGGLVLLRFYQVYRAMVRAKVALIGGAQREFAECLGVAWRLSCRGAALVVLMHGVSGSGKTTASERLVEALGAVRLRSDVERKRLHGMGPGERASAAPGAGIYGEQDARNTYERLAALAGDVLAAGCSVIVDATFLHRADRDRFRGLAADAGADLRIVACDAPEAVLRERVAGRERHGRDASDAGVAVLEAQLRMLEPLGGDERTHALAVDTGHDWQPAVESLAHRFGVGAR
jgi:hypothetical protein